MIGDIAILDKVTGVGPNEKVTSTQRPERGNRDSKAGTGKQSQMAWEAGVRDSVTEVTATDIGHPGLCPSL